ncbi:uncharacterized protein LOC143279413 [Babylonia areolata]|uniref:uncharacterized protein LOC143279413 n=1 Tax=Babylonia areolata TaxID=304850 RepID=UPI003FD3C499
MGSGSSKKKSPAPKAVDSKPSEPSRTSRSLSTSGSSARTAEPASMMQSKDPAPASGQGEKEKEQKKEQKEKSLVTGVVARGKSKAKWESFNVEDLMLALDDLDHKKEWYDVVDSMVIEERPVIVPNTKRKGWQTVRLFISSTFKDMHSEREHLVKFTIPVLREWCKDRKLNLIECDLRWGVPKDADTRETLMTCLSEIDRCREENQYPYFLSMLSERYGYVMDPSQVPDDIKARRV